MRGVCAVSSDEGPLSEIEADGLGVSFFGLYPQLCVMAMVMVLLLTFKIEKC